jgi:ABC-type oligopeptide transport system ATPase subunit
MSSRFRRGSRASSVPVGFAVIGHAVKPAQAQEWREGPTSRLDLITQKEVTRLLVETARERGMAILMVSHDWELVRKLSDRVMKLADGGTTV